MILTQLRYILLAALFSVSTITAQAQQPGFDYWHLPQQNFSFSHLQLDLHLDGSSRFLEGQAHYRFTANISGVDSLVLDAAHMDIRSVRLNEGEAPYRLDNDSLLVALGEPSERGREYRVEIEYRTTPRFGVHFQNDGTVWSSQLPRSARHWLPVYDHPRVAFTTDITLTVAGDHQALAPGEKQGEQVISTEAKEVQWVSTRPVPVSALWFAAGPLDLEQADVVGIPIRLAGAPESMEASADSLLNRAAEILAMMEERIGSEYPYETLSILLLQDHRWETKPYGAGFVRLFENRGSLTAQLRRAIAAQWHGVWQREEQWSDAEAMNLYQTIWYRSDTADSSDLLEDRANPEVSVNPYHAFSPKRWNRWQKFYPQWQDSIWKQTVKDVREEAGGVYTWNDYARSWYDHSGQPWFRPPQLVVPAAPVRRDSIVYDVEYRFTMAKSELELHFQAKDSVINELVTLPLIVSDGQRTDTLEVTFSGESESVMFNLDPLVSFVTVDASERADLYLRQYKPVPFLLGQLREADSERLREEAARQLAFHADNADLQLAINDLLSGEQPAGVRAALLYSLGEITSGAIGTERQFFDALSEDSPEVRRSAIHALRHFSGDEAVERRLQQVALEADSLPMFRLVVESLLQVTDSAGNSILPDFTNQLMSRDTTGWKPLILMEELVHRNRIPEGDQLVSNLNILIGAQFPYEVRNRAIGLLQTVDREAGHWDTRMNTLLTDNDPRIRYRAVRVLGESEALEASAYLEGRVLDEYDGRVYYEMKKVLQEQERESR